jgi:hypothetical protein
LSLYSSREWQHRWCYSLCPWRRSFGCICYRLASGLTRSFQPALFQQEGSYQFWMKKIAQRFLWTLRGAGQFFSLVTQLVIRTHSLSILGNDKGVICAGTFVFPLERAKEACSLMEALVEDDHYGTSGLMKGMSPLPARNPSLVSQPGCLVIQTTRKRPLRPGIISSLSLLMELKFLFKCQ